MECTLTGPFGRLDPLFAPRSVAVVGASATEGSFGHRVLSNLIDGGFDGAVHPVNPARDYIGDLTCYHELESIPGNVDCAVLVVPAAAVNEAVKKAIAKGVRAVAILAAGFKETGDAEGLSREHELAQLADESGIAILGPNCLGMMNFTAHTALTFGPGLGELTREMPDGGGLAVVSQSGGLGSFLLHAAGRGVPFSYFVSTGNSTAIDVGDCLGYLAADPAVTGFCLAYEGLRADTPLLDALELAQQHNKPVVALKTGRSRSGGAAAVSHTGSAVGDGAAAVAALKARSVMVVDALDELIEPASFLAKVRHRRHRSDGIAVATGSGGAAVMVCDSAERHNVRLARFSDSTAAAVAKRLPSCASGANPIDVTATSSVSGGDALTEVLEAVAGDEDVGALVVPLGVAYKEAGPSRERPAAIEALASRVDIPVAVVWLSQALESPGAQYLERSAHAGVFRSMELCFRTLAQLNSQPLISVAVPTSGLAEPAADRIEQLCRSGKSGLLDEIVSSEILEAVGIPMIDRCRTRNRAELATILGSWSSYPAVLKVISAELPHKSKVGGVRTALVDRESVLAAADDIIAAVGRTRPDARIDGFLLQHMALGSTEILVGGYRDPVYGPVVAVGAGGTGAGARSGVELAAAPLSTGVADALIRDSPAASALPDQAQRQLADAVTAIGSLMAASSHIDEIDINPLIVTHGGQCVAVDGLITIRVLENPLDN